MDGGEVAFVLPIAFFQFGFMSGDEAKRCVEQNGCILWVGVFHGGFHRNGFGLDSPATSDDCKQKHDYQTDSLLQLPMRFFFLFWFFKLRVLCYYDDNQHKENENNQQIPVVEKDLPDHAK